LGLVHFFRLDLSKNSGRFESVKLKSIIKICINVLPIIFLYATSFSSSVYTKETQLSPIRISDADLQTEIEKISNLIKSANAKAAYIENVTFISGKTKVQISGNRFLSPGVRIPKTSYEFDYYFSSGNDEAPITKVSMNFGDFLRRISVSGNSSEQVDAIFSTLESDFTEHSMVIGGSTIRSLGGFFLFYIFLGGFIGGSINCFYKKSVRYIGIPIFSGIGIILLFGLPFRDILAGFAVYQGNASFIVRYGYEISFFSLLITLLAIPFSYYLPLIFSKSKNDKNEK
jgi:hypothetical protein